MAQPPDPAHTGPFLFHKLCVRHQVHPVNVDLFRLFVTGQQIISDSVFYNIIRIYLVSVVARRDKPAVPVIFVENKRQSAVLPDGRPRRPQSPAQTDGIHGGIFRDSFYEFHIVGVMPAAELLQVPGDLSALLTADFRTGLHHLQQKLQIVIGKFVYVPDAGHAASLFFYAVINDAKILFPGFVFRGRRIQNAHQIPKIRAQSLLRAAPIFLLHQRKKLLLRQLMCFVAFFFQNLQQGKCPDDTVCLLHGFSPFLFFDPRVRAASTEAVKTAQRHQRLRQTTASTITFPFTVIVLIPGFFFLLKLKLSRYPFSR